MKTEYELPTPALYDATEDVGGYTAEQMQAAIHAAVLDEREACIEACLDTYDLHVREKPSRAGAYDCMAAIRNRSNT